MEFPLMISHSLRLSGSKEVNFFILQDGNGTNISTTARETTGFQILGREKLIQDLKYHGFATSLVPLQATSHGLKLTLGFQNVAKNAFNLGYLGIEGMLKLVTDVFGDQARVKDLKIRLDIEYLQVLEECEIFDDSPHIIFVPSTTGYIFNMKPDGKVEEKLNTISLRASKASDSSASKKWHLPKNQWEVVVSLVVLWNSREELHPRASDQLSVTRKMLENELLSDAAIIAECGTEVKCHRSVLAAHSSVFERMFQADMKEARTGIVEMPGMSEDSVRALLEYLNTWRTTAAEENAVICIDLLQTSDKYNIKPLETSMEQILLAKPEDWFTADAALQLVLQVKDSGLEKLKTRDLQLFKSKFNEVQELTAFQRLFKEEMKTVTELFAYLATY